MQKKHLTGEWERSLGSDGRSGQTPFVGCLVNNTYPLPHVLHKNMILKKVKVVCFNRLLKVYDSRGLTSTTSLCATPLWNDFSKLEKARKSEGLCRVTQMELYNNA